MQFKKHFTKDYRMRLVGSRRLRAVSDPALFELGCTVSLHCHKQSISSPPMVSSWWLLTDDAIEMMPSSCSIKNDQTKRKKMYLKKLTR